jgi:CBS domain-containing protein
MTVKEVMKTDIGACAPGDDLLSVLQIMREHKCGWVPVVDSHGLVQGVITDRDAALAVVDHPHRTAARIAAEEAMSHAVFSCLPDQNLKTVLAAMAQHRVRRLPVMDKSGHLQGVLSIDDIILAPERRGSPTAEEIVGALRLICAPRTVIGVAS